MQYEWHAWMCTFCVELGWRLKTKTDLLIPKLIPHKDKIGNIIWIHDTDFSIKLIQYWIHVYYVYDT